MANVPQLGSLIPLRARCVLERITLAYWTADPMMATSCEDLAFAVSEAAQAQGIPAHAVYGTALMPADDDLRLPWESGGHVFIVVAPEAVTVSDAVIFDPKAFAWNQPGAEKTWSRVMREPAAKGTLGQYRNYSSVEKVGGPVDPAAARAWPRNALDRRVAKTLRTAEIGR